MRIHIQMEFQSHLSIWQHASWNCFQVCRNLIEIIKGPNLCEIWHILTRMQDWTVEWWKYGNWCGEVLHVHLSGPKNNNKNPVSNTNSAIMQKISKWPRLTDCLLSCDPVQHSQQSFLQRSQEKEQATLEFQVSNSNIISRAKMAKGSSAQQPGEATLLTVSAEVNYHARKVFDQEILEGEAKLQATSQALEILSLEPTEELEMQRSIRQEVRN